MLLALVNAHPVCRDELAFARAFDEDSGRLDSKLVHPLLAVSTDENFNAQSLLIASYWFLVCLPTSRCNSSCAKVSNASVHPGTEHSYSGV